MHVFETQGHIGFPPPTEAKELKKLIMRCTSLPGNGKLSATFPQLPFLVQLRFIHVLSSNLQASKPGSGTSTRKKQGKRFTFCIFPITLSAMVA